MESRHTPADNEPTKRFKVGESMEVTNEVTSATQKQTKEYGGFECHAGDVLFMSYVRSTLDLENLRDLSQHKAEYPENIFQQETIKGLKNPRVRLYFTPVRLRFYMHFE